MISKGPRGARTRAISATSGAILPDSLRTGTIAEMRGSAGPGRNGTMSLIVRSDFASLPKRAGARQADRCWDRQARSDFRPRGRRQRAFYEAKSAPATRLIRLNEGLLFARTPPS